MPLEIRDPKKYGTFRGFSLEIGECEITVSVSGWGDKIAVSQDGKELFSVDTTDLMIDGEIVLSPNLSITEYSETDSETHEFSFSPHFVFAGKQFACITIKRGAAISRDFPEEVSFDNICVGTTGHSATELVVGDKSFGYIVKNVIKAFEVLTNNSEPFEKSCKDRTYQKFIEEFGGENTLDNLCVYITNYTAEELATDSSETAERAYPFFARAAARAAISCLVKETEGLGHTYTSAVDFLKKKNIINYKQYLAALAEIEQKAEE